jgi:hypothetical protein
MIKVIRLLFTFYRSYFIATFFTTCCCINIYTKIGIVAFTALFWFKITTLALIYYYINANKAHELYYYQNLDVSKRLLWISTLIFDFTLFISLLILTHKLR